MGWERKRGKIEEFNRLLRGATDTSFSTAGRRPRPCCRRSATASRSTPTRACRATPRKRLIGIIAHPLNRPRFDPRAAAASPRATASCSRASASRCRAPAGSLLRPDLRGPHRRRPLHDRGLRHLPGPVRRRASSPARASTTSTRSRRRSRDACPRTRCCRTTCSRGCTRAPRSSPTSRWSTTTRRACSRTRGGSTAGSAATGRSCSGCSRSCRRARGLRRNRLPLDRALEDPRQPAPQPRRAGHAAAAGRGWTLLPGRAGRLDAPGTAARWRCRSCPGCRACSAGRASAQPWSVFLRASRRRRFRVRPRGRPCSSRSWRTTRGSDAHAIVITLVRLVFTQRRLLEWETAAASTARRRSPARRGPSCPGCG